MNGSNKPSLSSIQAFFIGAVGGVAPVLVRGAVYLFSHNGEMPPLASGQVVGYFCALVIFLVFGGIVAIFRVREHRKKEISLRSTFPSTYGRGWEALISLVSPMLASDFALMI
jgi:hypothetical protein